MSTALRAAEEEAEKSRIRLAAKANKLEKFRQKTARRLVNQKQKNITGNPKIVRVSSEEEHFVRQDTTPNRFEDLSNHSEESNGLQLPEGCELAERITRSQEEHCSVWGLLLTSASPMRNETDELQGNE